MTLTAPYPEELLRVAKKVVWYDRPEQTLGDLKTDNQHRCGTICCFERISISLRETVGPGSSLGGHRIRISREGRRSGAIHSAMMCLSSVPIRSSASALRIRRDSSRLGKLSDRSQPSTSFTDTSRVSCHAKGFNSRRASF